MLSSILNLEALAAYDLTHVQYSIADPWGPTWALITLMPVFMLAVYFGVLLQRRELTYANALVGQFALIITGLTCYSRVYLMYHTLEQVYVGCSIGIAMGAMYYMLTERMPRRAKHDSLLMHFRKFLYTNYFARMLCLRDSWTVYPDGPIEIEYSQWLTNFQAWTKPPACTALQGSANAHLSLMLDALAQADLCIAVPTAFSVGCVIAADAAQMRNPSMDLDVIEALAPYSLFTGYSRELPGNTHAEECALEKLARYAASTPDAQSKLAREKSSKRTPLSLFMYTTMEPCSERLSGNAPCVDRIVRFNEARHVTSAAWLAKGTGLENSSCGALKPSMCDGSLRPITVVLVVQGVREPQDFVQCQGQRVLRGNGVDVISATPRALPATLGLKLPPLTSISMRVSEGINWLEDACLRMAKKGHKT
ncbi:hypothetical protein MVES_000084 [Malassezia vespertilionis]|uniref:CMP/dCMP-type deaminase domain-containing protein n=1 Tax=Malassezia vespertilionis TaxID=2020962 RepID=A0A2N1JHF3_9BASI|nr:hypothetical protein MVES_000084 [Malassezia vespertilionis]